MCRHFALQHDACAHYMDRRVPVSCLKERRVLGRRRQQPRCRGHLHLAVGNPAHRSLVGCQWKSQWNSDRDWRVPHHHQSHHRIRHPRPQHHDHDQPSAYTGGLHDRYRRNSRDSVQQSGVSSRISRALIFGHHRFTTQRRQLGCQHRRNHRHADNWR